MRMRRDRITTRPASPPIGDGVGVEPATTLRAMLLMVLGVGLLTAMDATVKVLTERLPVPQIAFFRCLLALPVLLAALPWQGGLATFRSGQPALQLLRCVLMTATGLLFFNALRHLPLADTLAITFAAPFLIAALSWPLLGERVAASGWGAIALGFLGVLVVLRPDGGLGTGAVLALGAATSYALASLLLRRIGRTDRAMTSALWGTLIPGAIYTGLLALEWRSPLATDWPLLMAVGAMGAVGTLTISAAYRQARASVLGTIEYSALIWGVLIGVAVFHEVPSHQVMGGSLLILVSGWLLLRAQRRPVG